MALKRTIGVLLEIIIISFLFLVCPPKSLAVTVSVTNYPNTITDDTFTLTASISGATAGTNYLRVDIYKDQTTSYFGETYNGADWYGGSTYTQYLPITIQTGVSWIGNIQGRVGSPTTSQYDGTGVYRIRLRRYTSAGGSTASEANNSSVIISINLPTPTPTPTDVPTPTIVTAPTSAPTNSPTLTKVPTITSKISVSPSVSSILEDGAATVSGDVLGTESGNLSSPNPFVTRVQGDRTENTFPKIIVVIGIVLLSACGILLVRQMKQNEEDSN